MAGLLLAGAYVCAMLVLLGTPLRSVLQAVFAPLGRMALTNYLTATLLVLAAVHAAGLPLSKSWTAVSGSQSSVDVRHRQPSFSPVMHDEAPGA